MGKKDKDKNKEERQINSIEALGLDNDGIVNGIVSGGGNNSSNITSSNANSITEGQGTSSNTDTTNSQGSSTTSTSTQSSALTTSNTTDTIDQDIVNAATTLKSINTIKEELCKLPLDLCERQFFDNRVLPLLTTINFLSSTSDSLMASVNTLTTSPIVPRKKGKLKDTINLVYDMNSKCKDIYKELEDRIDMMLKEDC